jgi:hypothetical protein
MRDARARRTQANIGAQVPKDGGNRTARMEAIEAGGVAQVPTSRGRSGCTGHWA